MNLFTSQQAPAILALILSVIGFYISTVVDEIRGQAALTYRFEVRSDDVAELRIKNVSLAQVVQDARFEIACADGREICLAPHASGDLAKLDREPPVSPTNVVTTATPKEAQLSAHLVPGAIVTLSVQRATSATDVELEFYYTASKSDPQAVLLFDENSLTAWFIDNYFDLMLTAFLAASGALALMILWHLRALWPRKTAAAPEDDPSE